MNRMTLLPFLLLTLAGAQTAAPTPPASTLNLLAPVGSSVELKTTNTSRITISNVQVSAVPGGKATPAQVEEARRSIVQGAEQTNKLGLTTVTGKAFFKVVSRDAAGNTTLLSTVVQTIPATAQKKAETITMRITQVIAPAGQVSGLKIESDNPQLNAVFSNLTAEKLQQFVTQSNTSANGVYGAPLVIGEPRTTTTSLDMQGLMGSLLGLMAGPQGEQMFGQVNSSPFEVTTTTTYRGLNAQQQHVLESSSTYGDWKMNLTSQDARMPMTLGFQLTGAKASSTSTYSANGLPSSLTQKTNMTMNLQMTMDDIQVTMTMNMEQGVNMQPR